MKCYYEILNVSKEADIADIKASYKKLVLKWHPDKNLTNTEYAKEQFQLIQQAYEVLSDRQERAWYDNHREQILRGANSGFEDSSLDVYQYFSSSCFKGFNDDDNSFYSIYRYVFEKLAKEELEHMENKEDFCTIPMFGNSQSDYIEVVKPFYDYWLNFATRKSYTWLDPYNITEVRDRRTLKLVEKENKKVRQKARKERNDEIRALVAFVKKRDKRILEHAKLVEAKKLENKQKQEKLKMQKQRERKEQLNNTGAEAEWTKFDNVQSELREIERNLAEQFSEDISGSEDDESEKDNDNLYCIACNKIFKTAKTFKNHELSKKHRENVLILKNNILQEEQQSDGSFQDENDDFVENDEMTEDSTNGTEQQETTKKSKKKKKSRKTIHAISSEDTSISDADDLDNEGQIHLPDEHTVSENDKPEVLTKPKKGKTTKKTNKNLEQSESSNTITENGRKKRLNKPNAKAKKLAATEIDTNHICVTCEASFSSKNKLFDHLKTTGHSVYLPHNESKTKHKKKIVK